MIKNFSFRECIWDAFFKDSCGINIPPALSQKSPRILLVNLHPSSHLDSKVSIEVSASNVPEQHGIQPIYPHQMLANALPLALSHLWMISSNMDITFWSLIDNLGFAFLKTNSKNIDDLCDALQVNKNDYDYILTGQSISGENINSHEGMSFYIRLWDVKHEDVIYEKNSAEDGLPLIQNVSHLATDLTNIILSNHDVKLVPDYQDIFAFWLRDSDLMLLGNILLQLCHEYLYARKAIENLPRYAVWPEILKEFAHMAQQYKRPEFYKAYFMYLMCRIMMPGVGEEEKKQFHSVTATIPGAIENDDLRPYIVALESQFDR